MSELFWTFRKKHKLEEFPVYLDDHPFQIYERMRQEMKAGMRTADVVLLPHYMALRLAADGVLAACHPLHLQEYPRNLRDDSNRWFAIGVTFMSMAYDTRRVREGGLPESLEELSSDKWRGHLGTQSLTASTAGNLGAYYISYLRRTAGEKQWNGFLESLSAANRPKTFDCIDHLLQGLLDGDVRIALTVYSLAYFREKTAGSPVALLRLDDAPSMLTFTSAGLVKGAEEKPSALTFLSFLLSREAQERIGSIPGISPSMPGVKASYPFEQRYTEKSDFHPDSLDLEALPSSLKTFKNLGLP